MELHFKITGALMILLALVHVVFPKYFNWEKELKSLSLINRQMMVVHTFFIALTVFLMGVLCLTSTDDLIKTGLGKSVSCGFAVFWTVRLLIQFWGYSAELWKGKAFETTVHILFSVVWIYFSSVFFWNVFS